MGEAERSIAVKRKIAIAKPMSREESPSEIYTPKRRKSESSTLEVSPPPYIPSRKESSLRSRNSAQDSHRRQATSKNDARQLLDRREHSRILLPARERQELISRSRRIELLQKLGLDRQEASSEREKRVKEEAEELVKKDEERARHGVDVVRNFKITAHVAPSARLSEVAKERLSKAVGEKERALQVILPSLSSKKGSIASRLGKVVVQRRSSFEREEDFELKDKPQVKSRLSTTRGRRLALSLIGKEVVKRQCEAAVLSVKSVRTRQREQIEPFDSRVVESQSLSDDEEQPEEKSSFGIVTSLRDHQKSEGDSPEKDSEDLDEMLKDDLEDLLQETSTDEFTLDLDDDEDLIKVVGQLEEEDMLSVGEKPQAAHGSGTRFIVTLDGVDDRRFEGKREMDFSDSNRRSSYDSSIQPSSSHSLHSLQPSSMAKPMDQAVFLQPQDPPRDIPVSKSAPPKIQPFSINLKDSDDEFEEKADPKAFYHHPMKPVTEPNALTESGEELTALQKSKLNERCKFWPACAAGAECKFHHPTSYCKTFPNCKFGDKCLFIHPNCKFDSKCTRMDCPFTHTSRRPALGASSQPFKSPVGPSGNQPYYPQYIPFSSSPSQSSAVCKFFPNCHNVNCPFVHPKPCRFGLSCQSPGCPFSHPSAPAKDKLKWTAHTDQPHQVKEAMMTTFLSPPSSSAKPHLSSQLIASNAAVSSTSV